MMGIELTGKNKRHLAVFFLFIFALTAFTVFGDKGLIDAYRLSKERDGIVDYNRSLAEKNSELEESIHHLKTDKRYIASIARKELGMLAKDEVIYKFDSSSKPDSIVQ